jgi:hypothetical protein
MGDINRLEEDAWSETSIALMSGRIRTKEDVEKDAKIVLNYIKWRKFYSHINPLNYFKKEKPFYW